MQSVLSSWNRKVRVAIFGFFALAIYLGNARLVVPSELPPSLIAVGVAIDLILWVPLLYYLIMQRSGAGPAFITRLLVTAGVFSTLAMLPENSVIAVLRAHYPAAIGVFAVGATLILTYRLARAWPEAVGLGAEERISLLSERLFGKSGVASIIRSEWTCAYYAVCGWRRSPEADQRTRFSYHKNSGAVGTLIGMSILHIPGVFFWHLIVHHAWPALALVFTGLHVYTMVFTVGQAMAMRHRFMEVSSTHLNLRFGMLFDTQIPLSAIDRVERATWSDLEKAPGRLCATFAAMANVRIVFHKPQKISLMAGITKPCTELVLGVDAPLQLMDALRRVRSV